MTKKKRSKLSFAFLKSSWMTALLVGLVVGIGSQRIPLVRAYTDEAIQPIEHQFSYSKISFFQAYHGEKARNGLLQFGKQLEIVRRPLMGDVGSQRYRYSIFKV